MTEQTTLPALNLPLPLALVEQPGALDKHRRRILEQQMAEMTRLALEHMAAQKAISFIYIASLRKADSTVFAAEFIKAMRSPVLTTSEVDGLDETLRQRYLEAVERISAHGTQKVLANLERRGG